MCNQVKCPCALSNYRHDPTYALDNYQPIGLCNGSAHKAGVEVCDLCGQKSKHGDWWHFIATSDESGLVSKNENVKNEIIKQIDKLYNYMDKIVYTHGEMEYIYEMINDLKNSISKIT
jgi:hypothetical protein